MRANVHGGIAIARDDVDGTIFRLLERLQQIRFQFRIQRNQPRFLADVVFRLARSHQHLRLIPVNVRPLQRQNFTGHANPAIPGQRNDELPLDVRSVLDRLINDRSADESLSLWISLRTRLDRDKWTLGEQFTVHGIFEELPGHDHDLRHVCRGMFRCQMAFEIHGLRGSDFIDRLVLPKEADELSPPLVEHFDRPGLQVRLATLDIRGGHAADRESRLIASLAMGCQAASGNSFVKLIADGAKPVCRVHVQGHTGPLRFGQSFNVEPYTLG
ncbi:MAG: hypothetical protein ABSB42_11215 [Tepidisphaeraceae bacterium]